MRRVAVEDGDRSRTQALALARATRVRDVLATTAGLNRTKIAVLPAPDSQASDAGSSGPSTEADPRIEIQLRGRDAATPARESSPKGRVSAEAGP